MLGARVLLLMRKAEGESNVVCQKRHGKVGGHRAECAVLASAAVVPAIEEVT